MIEPEIDDRERARILQLIAEDAQRIRDGLPSICANCEGEIPVLYQVYRCTDCSLPFHLWCARKHFAENGDEIAAELQGWRDKALAIHGESEVRND